MLICRNVVLKFLLFRLEELSETTEENPDCCDIELIQHISLDINRLIKLLNGKVVACF